jgi:SAM-dependent methyltransferase
MLTETARKKGFHQADRPGNFNLLNANAMNIPLPNETCDIVLANHMLYHVPDLPRTLAEIQRILKPGGTLLAATTHPDSMQEMRDQVEIACGVLGYPLEIASPIEGGFNLETGAAALRPFFANVQVYTFDSALVFPTPRPAIEYINSQRHYYARFLPAGLAWSAVLDTLKYTIGARIAGGGAFRVPKTSGVFVTHRESFS